jgi:hypothetical protein
VRDFNQSGSSAGAAVTIAGAVAADFGRGNAPQPPSQTQPVPRATLCGVEPSPSTYHPSEDEQQPQQQQQQDSNTLPFTKHLSLSTCGGSASNLTAFSNTTTTTTTTTNTNTCTSVAGSSAESTPLSGVSSHQQHQQQRIRARAQRVLAEANSSHRPSLDSCSSSSRHREDNEEEDEEVFSAVAVVSASVTAHPETISLAAGVGHFPSRRTPFSKRSRPQQQAQATQRSVSTNNDSNDIVTCAMHIPDPTTFADSSSPRQHTPMATADTISPGTVVANGNGSATAGARVHDAVDYEEEVLRAVQLSPHRQRLSSHPHEKCRNEHNVDADNSTGAQANVGDTAMRAMPTMMAGSNSATHAVAPDATPQEPPPKRFATGTEDAMEELTYGVMHQSEHSHPTHPEMSDNEEEEGEEVAEEQQQQQRRPVSVRRHRHTAVSSASAEEANGDNSTHHHSSTSSNTGNVNPDGEKGEGRPTNNSNTQPSERQGSTASRRAAHPQQQQQQQKEKDSRRKSRLTSNSHSAGSLLGMVGGRHSNDSITASIPYDPSRFHTPPLVQQLQQKSDDSPLAQTSNSTGLKRDITRLRSESQPSCATPPDATPAVPHPAQQQKSQRETFQPPPTRSSIALTETRYAFLALSFMMRMLCKLHKGEPIPSSDFHSHCIPPMSVTMYVQRLVRYCACSGEALLCAFLLLLKYVFHSGHPITIYNAHRLLITSVVLGIKLRDDVYYSNVYYGRIGGISGREMNKLEVLFLSKLDWETQVHQDEYAALLELLQELAIDVDPTPEQLSAFAAASPDEVSAYVLDEDDDEVEEAAAKLQQGLSPSAPASASSAGDTAGSAVASCATAAVVQQRKRLRGAYRLHQWHALVEPWMARLQEHVFAKKEMSAQAAAAAWQEEGVRWERYYREDEEATARLQRKDSSSTWLSPLTVQKRAASAATLVTNAGNANYASSKASGAGAGVAWGGEPPYQSAWSQADTLHYYGSGSSYATRQEQQQQQPESNVRYNNFINFANVVTGGNFGASSTGPAGGTHRHVSPASISQQQHMPSSGASSYYYGIGASHRVRSAPMTSAAAVATTAAGGVRYHTATERALRPSSDTFDITNRAATTTATEAASSGAGHSDNQSGSDSASRRSSGGVAITFSSQQQQQPQPSVAGTTARVASPASSTTPGSGININAQPYYYVSSRIRKQQQQQQRLLQQQQQEQQDTAAPSANHEPSSTPEYASPVRPATTFGATDTTSSSAAAVAARAVVARVTSPTEVSDQCSSGSSFTSPACVNPPTRFNNYPANPSAHSNPAVHSTTPNTNSNSGSGIEAVLAAMKRGSSAVLYSVDSERVVNHPEHENVGSSTTSNTAAVSANHTFPARPIAKGIMSGSHDSEPTTATAAAHVPRRSPQTAHQPPAHRRSTYAAQHSLGKKRSKPDSYKDY